MPAVQKITPFLWFDDRAEEAANFYVSLFDDSKIRSISRYTDTGPGPKGSVMVVELQIAGQVVQILNGGPHFRLSEAFSFSVRCESQAEIDRLWSALTANGGEESQCGWLRDRFGLSWQIIPADFPEMLQGDPVRADRVMRAMMTMRKFDVAKIRAAYEG